MSIDLFHGIQREELMAVLGRQIAAISEEATCCSWDYRVAEELPAACYAIIATNAAGDWMGTPISLPLARWLVVLAEHLGHWVDANGADWLPYVARVVKKRTSRTGHTAGRRPTAKK